MNALEPWHDFFVAEVGATGALVGLLFVALSINVAQILKYDWLPPRAAQTLVALTGALLVASLELFPDASSRSVVYATLAVSLFTWLASTLLVRTYFRILGRAIDRKAHPAYGTATFWTAHASTLPMLAGTILMAAGNATGLYFVAAGVLATLALTLLNAWVLLIEILR